ncbi:hypothetical protein DES36_10846 [Alkalibaculum bacchi]|uniref:B12-binding N-terminal domain-containing protein n=1 Tax=Alkalibaculum bacchi TaxID=645887 RepID=A0A366I7Z2_9FIRM|nr:B12-binding domain-containing protein [Alkalibaculum bacchi]RBP64431.1 hypothetical protein DES36_10846 [Alkalibaculum bacchi]
MKTIGVKNNECIVDYDELSKVVGNLDKDQIIHICQGFVNGDLDDDMKEVFIKAMKDGVDRVTKRFECGEYNIKDIIFMRDILDKVMKMIEVAMYRSSF